MISVLASVRVRNGKKAEFLEVFKANVPLVRAEVGCLEYFPAVDVDANLPPQDMDVNRVTIIEKWESLDALRDHLATAHMASYRERVQDIVAGVSLKVLEEA